MPTLTRTVWTLWLQGWENAPRLVRACARTWEIHNPGWTVHYLDRHSVRSFIGDPVVQAFLDDPGSASQTYADVIRLALLKQHGGVWADATTYCLRPLDDWIHDDFDSGFFAFANPLPGRVISSWFLAGELNNHVIQTWPKALFDYWTDRHEPPNYFWLNFSFAAACQSDPAFARVWEQTPKRNAFVPAYYHPKDDPLPLPLTERDTQIVRGDEVPLLKLYHRLPPGDYPSGSVVAYLCERLGL